MAATRMEVVVAVERAVVQAARSTSAARRGNARMTCRSLFKSGERASAEFAVVIGDPSYRVKAPS